MDDRVLGYHHVQNSPPWVVGLVSLVAILLFSLTITLVRTDQAPAWLLLLAVLSIAAFYLTVLSAARLTTRVTLTTVKLAWRLGWPSKTFDRAGIVATTAHRNSWIAGWGIRKVSRGWMWNVWGLDAVELELEGGSVFRIGTDDQSGLLTALGR